MNPRTDLFDQTLMDITLQNPIFFISPNIGVKLILMKNHPELINSKLKKIFERLGRNKQIVFKNNMEISESLLISAILEYHLNNRYLDDVAQLNSTRGILLPPTLQT